MTVVTGSSKLAPTPGLCKTSYRISIGVGTAHGRRPRRDYNEHALTSPNDDSEPARRLSISPAFLSLPGVPGLHDLHSIGANRAAGDVAGNRRGAELVCS